MINGEVERIRTAMTDLCEPLHDAFAQAEQKRRKQLPELNGRPYRWCRTHTIRALAHHHLSSTALGAWTLSGNHARNGEVWLTDGDYRLRVLHGYNEEHVPAPGTNRQRRAFYYNPPLPLHQQEPLMGPVRDQLLLLWRIDPETHAPTFRVVRPIGVWPFGARAKTDLDFPLPATADDLRNLHFEPQAVGMELQLPEEDTSDADGAGGFPG